MNVVRDVPWRLVGRCALLNVAGLALVAGGAAGGWYAVRDEPRSFASVAAGTCRRALDGLPAATLERLVPRSRDAAAWQDERTDATGYSLVCGLVADGDAALTASVKRVPRPPTGRLSRADGPGPKRKIAGYPESWSTRNGALLSVPCTAGRGDREKSRLYVRARADLREGEDVRAELVDLVERLVRTGPDKAGCDDAGRGSR